MFEDGLGEIQWPSKPDLPQIKKPGLHLFRTLNSVEPAVSSSIAANAANKRLNLTSWFCSRICSCCIFKYPGAHCEKLNFDEISKIISFEFLRQNSSIFLNFRF